MQKYWQPIAIAAMCVLIAAAPASAQVCDKTFSPSIGNTGDWDDDTQWDPPLQPTAEERACIPAGKTAIVDVSNAVADSIDVDGAIQIDNGAKLTIDITSKVDGVIYLTGTLRTTWIFRIHGTGEIRLIPDGNTPKIHNGFQLTLDAGMTIKGAGRIEGPFQNDGTVRADGGTLDVALAINLGGDGTWIAQNGGTLKLNPIVAIVGAADFIVEDDSVVNKIEIRAESTNLSGSFTIENGSLHLYEDICTTGGFSFEAPGSAEFVYTRLDLEPGTSAKFHGVSCP